MPSNDSNYSVLKLQEIYRGASQALTVKDRNC